MEEYMSEGVSLDDMSALNYDDGATYEEQVAALPVEETPQTIPSGLASRISANRIYLPPENTKGKRRRDGNDEESLMEEGPETPGADGDLRPNALYLQGLPIAHLPTNNIFAYARHFDTEPVGLEWIDDQSCVLVYPTTTACHHALSVIRKSLAEEPDIDDCYTAKLVPIVIWPPEDRINKTLGASAGLDGPIVTRIARKDDKKVRGAKQRSEFYRKHGTEAGKDPNAHVIGRAEEEGSRKRKRDVVDEEETRRELDAELDNFLHDDEGRDASAPASPPSKMRSDHIVAGERSQAKTSDSLLQRTLVDRVYKEDEKEGRRRRRRGGRNRRRKEDSSAQGMPIDTVVPVTENEARRRAKRPKRTLQELDDELQAFLDEKN